tara:strand:+ start:31 stop:783 length:753 start_codon:yes stop_codon:yes gene_type:complete
MALTKVGKEGITGVSNSSDATAITIDSSEKVVIGATSGSGKLTVQDSSFPKIQANYQGSKHLEMGVGGSGAGFVMTDGHFMTFNHQPYANAGSDTNLTERMRIDANGHITMPTQPAFLVTKSGAQDNITANTTVTITFDSEIFDQNADFASNTFTAPVTGRYYLQFRLNLGSTDQDTSNFQAQIAASNRTFSFNFDHGALDQDAENHTMNGSTLMDMDASDTCTIRVYQSGGANQVDVSSSSTFSGFLAC